MRYFQLADNVDVRGRWHLGTIEDAHWRGTGDEMTLQEAVGRIEGLSESDVLFARRPWSGDSECAIGELDETYRVPEAIASAGLEYFLEVHVALEVLEAFGKKPATASDRLRLLLHYAENDAYPDWVWER